MAKIPAIYGSAEANLFSGITPTCTASPLTSYALATFALLRPDWRIKFGVKTLTLTWSGVSSAITGDIFALPVSNLDAGSSIAVLTNGSGLSQALTVPALPEDGVPLTTVVDLSGSFTAAQRKSSTWNLVITGNSVNLTFGACIGLYGPKTTFLGQMAGDNFAWEYEEDETHGSSEKKNEYLTRFILDTRTRERSIQCVLRLNDTGLASMRSWFRGNHGDALPSLFWTDPNIADPLIGTWATTLKVVSQLTNYRPVTLTFTELSKGLPLL